MAHAAYIFEDVLDGGLHPSTVFVCLAGMNRPMQTTRGGLDAEWFPDCVICSDSLPELEVKEWEEKMYPSMQAHEWQLCGDGR